MFYKPDVPRRSGRVIRRFRERDVPQLTAQWGSDPRLYYLRLPGWVEGLIYTAVPYIMVFFNPRGVFNIPVKFKGGLRVVPGQYPYKFPFQSPVELLFLM